MIHQEKHHAVGGRFLKAADGRLHGRQLALLPLRIDDNLGAIERNFLADLLGMSAEDDARAADHFAGIGNFLGLVVRLSNGLQQASEKVLPRNGISALGGTHPRRLTARKNDRGEHASAISAKRFRRRGLSPPRRTRRRASRRPCAPQLCARRPWLRGARQSIPR